MQSAPREEGIHAVIRCAVKLGFGVAAIPIIEKLSHLPIVADSLRTRGAGSDMIAPMTIAMTTVTRTANRLPIDHVLEKGLFHFMQSLCCDSFNSDPFKGWVGPSPRIAAAASGHVA